jgi:hypothetical protein
MDSGLKPDDLATKPTDLTRTWARNEDYRHAPVSVSDGCGRLSQAGDSTNFAIFAPQGDFECNGDVSPLMSAWVSQLIPARLAFSPHTMASRDDWSNQLPLPSLGN